MEGKVILIFPLEQHTGEQDVNETALDFFMNSHGGSRPRNNLRPQGQSQLMGIPGISLAAVPLSS